MRAGKNWTLVFVLPFTEMVSNHVRAKCLEGFEPKNWSFIYLKGIYPQAFDFFIIRTIYRFSFYVGELLKLKFRSKQIVAYFIKPQSPILLWTVRRVLRIKVIIDINDPYHLPELFGNKVTKLLLNNADHLVFESDEYCAYWSNSFSKISSIISDTPQHECIYIDSYYRAKTVCWIGSAYTSPYLKNFIEHFKLFNDYGYEIRLIGCDKDTADFFREGLIRFSQINHYDSNILAQELSSSLISFVPMPNNDLFLLRGNLKAKVSMGYGCLTIASRNSMHENLIQDGINGYLFDSLKELELIIIQIQSRSILACVASAGNKHVSGEYSRKSQAEKLTRIAEAMNIDS